MTIIRRRTFLNVAAVAATGADDKILCTIDGLPDLSVKIV